MGDPKFRRKKYETPSHPWQTDRIEEENELIKKHGLKNKREVWKAKSMLRNFRGQARDLFPLLRIGDKQGEKEARQLLNRLIRLGILNEGATLEDVLSLSVESLLARRLQTIIYLKGFAHTPKQARQFIIHGHIAVGNRCMTVPSYMVKGTEETEIEFYPASSLSSPEHPMRPKIEPGSADTRAPKPEPNASSTDAQKEVR